MTEHDNDTRTDAEISARRHRGAVKLHTLEVLTEAGPQVFEVTAEELADARDWLADVQSSYSYDYEDARDILNQWTPARVADAIEKHYDGGIAAFISAERSSKKTPAPELEPDRDETPAEELGRLRRELTEYPASDRNTPEHAATLDRIAVLVREAAEQRAQRRRSARLELNLYSFEISARTNLEHAAQELEQTAEDARQRAADRPAGAVLVHATANHNAAATVRELLRLEAGAYFEPLPDEGPRKLAAYHDGAANAFATAAALLRQHDPQTEATADDAADLENLSTEHRRRADQHRGHVLEVAGAPVERLTEQGPEILEPAADREALELAASVLEAAHADNTTAAAARIRARFLR